MTLLQKETTSGIEKKSYGLGSYFVVALVAVVVGVGAVVGYQSLTTQTDTGVVQGRIEAGLAQQKAIQETAVIGSRTQAGLVQQAAIYEQQLLQSRIESGLAQSAAIREPFELLQSRIESGLAQSAAISGPFELLHSRIESGLAQSAAIQSGSAFRDAWTMRGKEMSNHLDDLIASGEASRK